MGSRSDRTREKLLSCAIGHFSRQGYAATNLMEIAQEVGVTRGPLYYYFSSKAQLYHAAVDHVIAQMKKDYEAVLVEDRPVLEVIRADYLCCLKDKGLFFHAGNGGKSEPDSSRAWRAFMEWLIARKYQVFGAAKARGELPADCDLGQLITFIYTFYHGIIQVKSLAQEYAGFDQTMVENSADFFIAVIRRQFLHLA